jgi:hypothetical protein
MTSRAGVARSEETSSGKIRPGTMLNRKPGKDGGRIRPRINLLEEPGKGGRLEAVTEISRSSYILRVKGQPEKSKGRPSGWKSWNNLYVFPAGCGKSGILNYGGVDPLRSGSSFSRRCGNTGHSMCYGPHWCERKRVKERERIKKHLYDCDAFGSTGTLAVNRSGRAGLKEGADAVAGEWSPQEEKTEPEESDVTSRDLRGKGWWCTVRLFGTNSLKEGAM